MSLLSPETPRLLWVSLGVSGANGLFLMECIMSLSMVLISFSTDSIERFLRILNASLYGKVMLVGN